MNNILLKFKTAVILLISNITFSQIIPGNGICDLPIFTDWSTGNGNNPCACLFRDPVYGYNICSFGNCGNAELQECAADCALFVNGLGYTNGPGWAQGGGNAGENLCLTVLSVELSQFYGTSNDVYNDIYWTTESEINNDFFEIKHSSDGLNYSTLVNMKGAGNTSNETHYRFLHYNSVKGINYYKLKQVDYDGSFVEYGPISIDNRDNVGNSSLFSELYPNPANDLTFFNYNGVDFNTPIIFSIYNSTSILVKEIEFKNFNLYQGITVSTIDLANGSYQIVISQGDLKKIERLIIIK